jgi:aspartate aminotransferase
MDHEYLPIEGLASFTEASARFMLGKDSPVIAEKRYTAVQAVSGTGAVRFGAELLAEFKKGAKGYISNPTWGNHRSIFQMCGISVGEYRYWNPKTNSLDIDGMLEDLKVRFGSMYQEMPMTIC